MTQPASPGAEYIEQILGREGLLSSVWPGFQWREGQVMGAYPIDGAIRQKTHVIIEAPTGTGKTLMYLVPAVFHAVRHGRRILVVTANLTLQRQLMDSDLPNLRAVLPWPFTYAELKGRNNFICRKRAGMERDKLSPNWSEQESFQVKQLLAFEQTSLDGDKTRLPYELYDNVSKRLFVTSDDCDRDRCHHHHRPQKTSSTLPERDVPPPWESNKFPKVEEEEKKDDRPPRCFADVARDEAMAAQIVVTNYHMLCLHLRGYAKVLPKFDVAILDEAHMAADIARKCFGYDLTPASIPRSLATLRELAKESGTEHELDIKLPGVETIMEPDGAGAGSGAENDNGEEDILAAPPPEAETIDVSKTDPGDLADRLVKLSEQFFDTLGDLRDAAPVALPRAEFFESWRELHHGLLAAGRLCMLHADAVANDSPKEARHYEKAGAKHFTHAEHVLNAMTLRDRDRWVYYVQEEGDRKPRLILSQRALLVDEQFQQGLFTDDKSVILTSATLRTNGNFKFICRDLGLDHERTTKTFLASPFDMARQARLIVPAPDARMPAPTDPEFDDMVVRMLRHVITMARGRTLALFTSWARLRYVEAHLGDIGYRVLVQGKMSRDQLLRTFREDVSSVLLGTGSFWAGIDVPGEALSCVVIDKLPFEPDDPLSIAMKDVMKRRDLSPFQHWALPRAMLTFKQGLGRLIRRTTDHGIMMVLDNRLTRKPYGRQFLQSLDLPGECVVYRSEVIAEFLGTAQS